MKWINVKDELPEKGIEVIVAMRWISGDISYDIAMLTDEYDEYDEDEWRLVDGESIVEYTPDYWAPIAPLPKDGE